MLYLSIQHVCTIYNITSHLIIYHLLYQFINAKNEYHVNVKHGQFDEIRRPLSNESYNNDNSHDSNS